MLLGLKETSLTLCHVYDVLLLAITNDRLVFALSWPK